MSSELAISDVVGRFAETELRKFQRAAEITSSQMLITDSKGIIEYVNPAFSRVTGFTFEEAVGKTPALLKSGRIPSAFYERMWELISTGSDWGGELINRRKNGELYLDKATISAIKGNDGKITHFVKVAEDITLQRLAEDHHLRRLKLTESINAANLEFMKSGSLHKMADIILKTCMSVTNSPFAILYDLLPNGNADILALSITSLDPISEVPRFREIQNELLKHGHYEVPLHASLLMAPVIENRIVIVNVPAENTWKECSCRMCSPLVSTFAGFPLKSGSVTIGMIGIANNEQGYSNDDIPDLELFADSCSLAISAARAETVRKATREQLMRSQKMEAIGQLASGIAHDFNNLLTVVIGYGTLALQKTGEDHPAAKGIEQIIKAGERATTLVRQLLAFGIHQISDSQPVEINTLVNSLHELLRRLISEEISLKTRLEANVGLIMADPSQLEQLIMNLVINARDAMERRGGEITIETANQRLDSSFVDMNKSVIEGEYVLLSVRDNGMGMSKEVISRIFEPFYTTKTEYGTGLGLATVYGIVNQCNGYIQVLSEVGAGSEFRVYLPRIYQTLGVSEPEDTSQKDIKSLEADGLILVVEDDPDVLDMVAVTLRSLGYRIIAEQGPLEALKIFDQHIDEIDLLLTDIVMPDMSGAEMAVLMREKRPDLKLLFMSGYSDDKLRSIDLSGDFRFLTKPFSTFELSKLVHDCLTEYEG